MSHKYMSKATPKAIASGIPVFCAHDAIVPIEKVIPNPKNPNTHPAEQIKLLGRIIQAAGWRQPITVSNRSGFIVKGHGRLLAAKKAGLTEVPVDYQEYANEAAYFDTPPFPEFLPEFDEVHVSCTFTWDMSRAEFLQEQWQAITDKPVLLGGPAYNNPCHEFTPGMYVKPGVTFTSRGCVNHCDFCFVPKREGKIFEFPEIAAGHIIQDNNFLACSKRHKAKVYDMLKTQKGIEFRGGLESEFINDWDVEQMRGLRIKSLWMACDGPDRVQPFIKAIEKLKKAGFNRNKIYCYALIGDDMAENEARLRQIYEAGAMPFASLFQPEKRITYSKAWKDFQRQWCRPAIIKARMEETKP